MIKTTCAVLGGLVLIACGGSRDVPASSAANVENATDAPNNGPDFSPASDDGTFAAKPTGARAAEAGPGDDAAPTSAQPQEAAAPSAPSTSGPAAKP